ncbi:hypothetical protein G6O67_006968 [Ophiocordyceps sinensis]|uniref:Uncharacterized protein n=1 Tax=Ophiocordyceps sinensis TaxID=72228 RepID=A0A8H4LSU8_9HYPO|nr:hypothetical protein G6O67_006968 [Ophiocordyceps sinensis]
MLGRVAPASPLSKPASRPQRPLTNTCNMSRRFTSTAKCLQSLSWVRAVDATPSLASQAVRATIDESHETKRRDGSVDPLHIAGQILNDTKRLTSYHAYGDGRVIFSAAKYNNAPIPSLRGSYRRHHMVKESDPRVS